jgi:chromosome partitioning protein
VKIVVFASTKGGAGKSTLAQALAVEASKEGPVFLADIDPQQSVAKWWERRGGPTNPMLAAERTSVTRVLEVIERRKATRPWLFVDTPGSMMQAIKDALKHAHAILVVVRPSSKDLEAQGALEDLIVRSGKTDRALYVINGASKTDKLAKDAAAFVAGRSVLPPLMICNRVDHVRADIAGKTAAESNKDAAKEIAALWAAVKRIVK